MLFLLTSIVPNWSFTIHSPKANDQYLRYTM
jgi:hypothetical protein